MKEKKRTGLSQRQIVFLKALCVVLGKKGLWLVVLGMFASFVLACVEYGLSSLTVALLFPLLGAASTQLSLIPKMLVSLPPKIMLGALLLVIALRPVCKMAATQSAHVLLQLAIQRFRKIQGYELLMTPRGRYLPLSNVNTRFGELIPKASEFIFFGMTLLVQLLYACALLAGMLFMSWRETLLAVCLMLILGLVVLRGTRFLTAASEDIARQSLYLEASIVRVSKNWFFIRLMHTIHREMLAFLSAVQNYYRQGVRMFFCVNVLSVLPEFVGMMSITLLLFIKIYGFGRGGAELLIFFYLFVRFIQAMSFVNDQFGKMGNCWHHACEMLDLTSSLTPAEIKDALDDRPLDHREIWRDAVQQKNEKPLPCPDLQLHHVSFTWPGMDAPLFDDLSVIITEGAHYGVIGPNGSGKSTLLALALGVLEPDRGVVRIGGIEPGQFVKKRRDLGFVGAEPYLFEGTIFENITYGCGREMTDEEVWAALETVGLLATVRQLKGALHAKIGEGGDGFSSGEKQRLALGRAILRRPTLLVMDEATANLDSKMENDVVKILRSLHGACTVITVTHRSEILKAADAVLDLGKLPSRRTV